MSVWLDAPWMLGDSPECCDLADEIEALLRGDSIGLSCDAIAERLRRRRADVLETLRRDSRFVHAGGGHASRWRLAKEMPLRASQDGFGREGTELLDAVLPQTSPDPQSAIYEADELAEATSTIPTSQNVGRAPLTRPRPGHREKGPLHA